LENGVEVNEISMWQNGASMTRQHTVFDCVTKEEGTTKHVNCEQCDCDSDSDCDCDSEPSWVKQQWPPYKMGPLGPGNSQTLATPLYVGIL